MKIKKRAPHFTADRAQWLSYYEDTKNKCIFQEINELNLASMRISQVIKEGRKEGWKS